MSRISKETATAIAYAYREVETARDLLEKITEALSRREHPDIRDAFGRQPRGLELGVPSSDTSRRLFDVPYTLAKPIIEAHIAHHESIISALSEKAVIEVSASILAGDPS